MAPVTALLATPSSNSNPIRQHEIGQYANPKLARPSEGEAAGLALALQLKYVVPRGRTGDEEVLADDCLRHANASVGASQDSSTWQGFKSQLHVVVLCQFLRSLGVAWIELVEPLVRDLFPNRVEGVLKDLPNPNGCERSAVELKS